MAKKKELDEVLTELNLNTEVAKTQRIAPLEFADVSVLRDKLNEVITYLNR